MIWGAKRYAQSSSGRLRSTRSIGFRLGWFSSPIKLSVFPTLIAPTINNSCAFINTNKLIRRVSGTLAGADTRPSRKSFVSIASSSQLDQLHPNPCSWDAKHNLKDRYDADIQPAQLTIGAASFAAACARLHWTAFWRHLLDKFYLFSCSRLLI
jgi:hypothetical protein